MNIRDYSGESLGRYQLQTRLAVGGMAEIYLARAAHVKGPAGYVVIKMLRPRFAQDPAFVRMFLDEAHLAKQLQHENIGQVYDIGEEPGRYYIAMEYLHGYDARELLEQALVDGQRVPLEHAIAVVSGVAAGLHHAHERRDPQGRPLEIVHRDVSPSNIFITYDGRVKLVDFGLARAATQGSQFGAGVVHGKSAYMSPEQCKSERLDRRSDVFSLGTVLYELTTARRLFRTDPTESHYVVMDRIVSGLVPPPSSVVPGYPAGLERIVTRALAVDPIKRYPTAESFLLDLQALASKERLSLSRTGLAKYLEKVFGHKPEPWRELEMQDEDDPSDEDGFEDEVATTLYAGDLDDIEDLWAVQRSSQPAEPIESARPSQRRLALPLVAEDSDVFQTPLLAQLAAEPPPGELAEKLERAASSEYEEMISVVEEEPQPPEAPPVPEILEIPVAEQRVAVPTATVPLAPQRSRWWLVGLLVLLFLATAAATVYFLELAPLTFP